MGVRARFNLTDKYLRCEITMTKKSIPSNPPAPGRSARESRERELSTAVIAFHEAVAARVGLSVAEWKCLGVLDLEGPATAGRLAAASGFTTGAITGIVDRLERAGYVRREAHPTDRRSVVIRPLRVAGLKAKVGPVFASLRAAMAAVAGRYRPAELAAIEDYLARVTQVLREEAAKVRGTRH
jgi:DNA-binding MarR family transcriptional regulator